VFRSLHPGGKNTVVCSHVAEPFTRHMAGMDITFTGLDGLAV